MNIWKQTKKHFSHISARTGNSEVYHDTVNFYGQGDSCDLYFNCVGKELKQEQVDIYSQFENNYKNYIAEIERFISNNLTTYEQKVSEEIKNLELTFDIIDVPYDNSNYDIVLVCGKTYRKFLFFKKEINIRIEFKNGKIKTIQRKNNTIEDNK